MQHEQWANVQIEEPLCRQKGKSLTAHRRSLSSAGRLPSLYPLNLIPLPTAYAIITHSRSMGARVLLLRGISTHSGGVGEYYRCPSPRAPPRSIERSLVAQRLASVYPPIIHAPLIRRLMQRCILLRETTMDAQMSGPTPIQHKIWRDIIWIREACGSSIEYDENTGDAVWKVHLSSCRPSSCPRERPLAAPGRERRPEVGARHRLLVQAGVHPVQHHRHAEALHRPPQRQGLQPLAPPQPRARGHRFCRPRGLPQGLPARTTITLQVVFYRPEPSGTAT